MSLIRQIGLLLAATLLLAFAAGVAVDAGAVRDTIETQLRLKNNDNAVALAQVLSQQKGDRQRMAIVAAAQFDTGFYRRIAISANDGQMVFERTAAAVPARAPGWFTALLPIEPAPGRAEISDGWHALGAIEVASQSAFGHDALWRATLQAALALAGVGSIAGLLAWLGVGRIRRPLEATVEQAAALQRGHYRVVAEPSAPELRRLTRAMNAMVERLRVVFEGQAAQVETLRREANCDAATGLANRAHFMTQLNDSLQREDGQSVGGLVLLRVLELAELNRRCGRDRVDRLIRRIAETLQTYGDSVAGALVGRLNGSDFALALPEGGVAGESAHAIVELLRAAFASLDAPGAVVAGAVETRRGIALDALMGAVDLALARAEAAGAFRVEAAQVAGVENARFGERGWRERLVAALAGDGSQLGSFAVVDARRRLIHLESPLRLRLDPTGPFEVAAHWLPMAIRSRLTCEVDERALALALAAIARDGRPRCVNLAPASLADSGFGARLRRRLEAAPLAARRVALEVHESAAAERLDLVQELARQLRHCGARFGLEHAGERLTRIERLFEAGLDYVKLDASVGRGVAADPRRTEFVKGLVTMLHGLSLQVISEGVADAVDADALWLLGVDGMTGPFIALPPAPAATA